jgi:hypothetical protein
MNAGPSADPFRQSVRFMSLVPVKGYYGPPFGTACAAGSGWDFGIAKFDAVADLVRSPKRCPNARSRDGGSITASGSWTPICRAGLRLPWVPWIYGKNARAKRLACVAWAGRAEEKMTVS